MACQMTFMSIGNAKASIIVAVMRKFVLLIPLIYLMPQIFTADKTKAVYMAEPVADIPVSYTHLDVYKRQVYDYRNHYVQHGTDPYHSGF